MRNLSAGNAYLGIQMKSRNHSTSTLARPIHRLGEASLWRVLSALLLCAIVLALRAAQADPIAGNPAWAHATATPGADAGNSVAVDHQGNAVIAITSLPVSPGSFETLIAKYNPQGALLWSNTVRGAGSVIARSIAVDLHGDVLLAGQFSGRVDLGGGEMASAGGPYDVFIAKFSGANGAYVWSQRFGGSGSDLGSAVAADRVGDAVVTGHWVTPEGTFSIFLIKLSSMNGNVMWRKDMTNASGGVSIGTTLRIAPNGDIIFAGHFVGFLNLGGDQLGGSGDEHMFISKFSATGHHRWSRAFDSDSEFHPTALALDKDGAIAVTGYFRSKARIAKFMVTSSGERDIFLVKLSTDGVPSWAISLGGAGEDEAYALAFDPHGDLVLAGAFRGSLDVGGKILNCLGVRDGFLARYSADGGALSATALNCSFDGQANGLACDSTGCVFVTGYFSRLMRVGQTVLQSGGPDAFLLKFPSLSRP